MSEGRHEDAACRFPGVKSDGGVTFPVRAALVTGVLAPLIGLLVLIVTLAMGEPWGVELRRGGYLPLIMIPGMAFLSMTILVDNWICRGLSGVAAANARLLIGWSSMITLAVLCMWVACNSPVQRGSDTGEMVFFVCLPTLLICGGLLWSAVQNIPRSSARILTLLGFTVATTILELWIQSRPGGRWADVLIMSHSMLVALASAVWLCVWSWRTFSAKERGYSA